MIAKMILICHAKKKRNHLLTNLRKWRIAKLQLHPYLKKVDPVLEDLVFELLFSVITTLFKLTLFSKLN
jgi:hypothetical protein